MVKVQHDDTPIICNGFKDDEYIEAVILAAKLGKNIIPVVEKFRGCTVFSWQQVTKLIFTILLCVFIY